MSNALPSLDIGGLKIFPPIIQGGMGIMVSGPHLAAAVSNTGAMGTLAAVGSGEGSDYEGMGVVARSALGFRDMIRATRASTSNPIAVNIMCALSHYIVGYEKVFNLLDINEKRLEHVLYYCKVKC